MNMNPLDEQTIEGLLSGELSSELLSPGVASLAELVTTLKSPATASELSGESHMVSSFKSALGLGVDGIQLLGRKRSMISHFLGAKAALAAAAVFLSGGVAAAATGSLPVSFQSALSSGLSQVGVSIPNGHGQSSSKSGNGLPNGQDKGLSSGASLYGLCKAYTASTPSSTVAGSSGVTVKGSLNSVEFQRLQKAAGTTDVTAYCSSVKAPNTKTVSGVANAKGGNPHKPGNPSANPKTSTASSVISNITVPSLPASESKGGSNSKG